MLRRLLLTSLCLTVACDGQEKPEKRTAEKKSPTKGKAADSKTADPKTADGKAEQKTDAKVGDSLGATPEAPHLEISHDKSGALARAAAVLEAEGIDNDDLRELSHHAEKLPSNATVCEHLAAVHKEGDADVCVEELEHVIARLGPELYAEVATCLVAAKNVPGLDACFAAEKHAEKELHEHKHGDSIDKATCEKFFTKFEQLAMKGAGDESEHVKKALETVKDDIVVGCMEQGAKAEIECVDKAKSLHELKECAPESK